MKNLFKDDKFKKLLKTKKRYELLSWLIPIISITSLLLILYLISNSLQKYTILVLVVVIIVITSGYIYDSSITVKINDIYNKLNDCFQNQIVPDLLKEYNSTIVFNKEKRIPVDYIEKVEVFDNYREYKSIFHYEGIIDDCKFSFDEITFDNIVGFDTKGQKIFNENVKNNTNYHWYKIELNNEFPTEAIFKISEFENYEERLFKTFEKFDLFNNPLVVNGNYEFELYLKDIKLNKLFANKKILKLFSEEYFSYNSIIIYVYNNELNIVIEEYDDLINLGHSNKVTVDNLLAEFNEEQKMILMILHAFNN